MHCTVRVAAPLRLAATASYHVPTVRHLLARVLPNRHEHPFSRQPYAHWHEYDVDSGHWFSFGEAHWDTAISFHSVTLCTRDGGFAHRCGLCCVPFRVRPAHVPALCRYPCYQRLVVMSMVHHPDEASPFSPSSPLSTLRSDSRESSFIFLYSRAAWMIRGLVVCSDLYRSRPFSILGYCESDRRV